MHLTKNIICLLLFTVFVNTSNAQNFDDALEKVNSYYKTASDYNIETVYRMYRGYTGNIITESYKGTMYKSNEVMGLTALGAEVITFSNAQITVNDKNKTITYIKNDSKVVKKSMIDTSKLSNFYDLTNITEGGDIVVYELTLKEKVMNVPYSKLIFHINKKHYSLIKQEFFFTSKLPFTNKKGEREHDFGRMEIIYNSIAKALNKNIKIEDYLVIDNNNKMSLSKTYKNYQLINQAPYN